MRQKINGKMKHKISTFVNKNFDLNHFYKVSLFINTENRKLNLCSWLS